MKSVFLLALCYVGVLAVPHGQTKPITLLDLYATRAASGESRIIGGSAAEFSQFPWQVAVYWMTPVGSYLCGGSLIDPEWVLTAAHCVQGAVSFTLDFGTISRDNPQVTARTTTAYVHPNYNSNTLNNDIALIQLDEPVELSSTVQTIRLPVIGTYIGASVGVTVSGFGRTSDDSQVASNELMYVDLTTISNIECASVYGTSVIVSSTICAVGNPYHSTCNGDSGGPLVVYDGDGVATLIGVVSFVANAGCGSGFPSGYVRTESFLDWIQSYTG